MKILNRNEGAPTLQIHAEDGRVLLAIHADGTVSGDVENASEAGARFVAYLREHWAPKRIADERASIIAELRWLADAREKYQTDTFPQIAREVQTARQLADVLESTTPVGQGGHGFGWIPSWMWDEWDEMAAPSLRVPGAERARLLLGMRSRQVRARRPCGAAGRTDRRAPMRRRAHELPQRPVAAHAHDGLPDLEGACCCRRREEPMTEQSRYGR